MHLMPNSFIRVIHFIIFKSNSSILVTTLDRSTNAQVREESAKLLCAMIGSSEYLCKPYVPTILPVLCSRLADPDPNVASAVFATLGQLAKIGGVEMRERLDDLFPIILSTIQETSQRAMGKRQMALQTLGDLIQSTGYAIEPYLKYHDLLSILTDSLSSQSPWPVRREVLRVLGIIGALDPWRSLRDNKKGAKIAEPLDCEYSLELMKPEIYPALAVKALVNLLTDSTLSKISVANILDQLMWIFDKTPNSHTLLPQVMPKLLNLVQQNEEGRDDYLQKLNTLATLVRDAISPYLSQIFTVFYSLNLFLGIFILNISV
jgi:FKBP12-rapamycin complex-associated protein